MGVESEFNFMTSNSTYDCQWKWSSCCVTEKGIWGTYKRELGLVVRFIWVKLEHGSWISNAPSSRSNIYKKQVKMSYRKILLSKKLLLKN